MSKIVVAGSLHYDVMLQAHHRPEKGETVIGSGCHFKFGGKGGNQAVSAAQAGAQVAFVGAVGADANGEFLRDVLTGNGIDIRRLATLEEVPSGMSVAISDAEGDYGAVVVSNANNHIPEDVLSDAALWDKTQLLILQNEVPESVNIHAAQAAHRHQARVCLNAAPARLLSQELASNIDILVVNGVEARDLSGIEVTDLDSARAATDKLSERFPAVVVTAGEHGVAFGMKGETARSLPAIPVMLVSTHGAGDCFVGVLCNALSRGESLAQACQRANEAAAEHVSRIS
jgi:ribokinase